MPQTPHAEKHFTGSETIRDVVIGMSDGLTVPFALAADLSGAVASSHIVVMAGLGRDRRRVEGQLLVDVSEPVLLGDSEVRGGGVSWGAAGAGRCGDV